MWARSGSASSPSSGTYGVAQLTDGGVDAGLDVVASPVFLDSRVAERAAHPVLLGPERRAAAVAGLVLPAHLVDDVVVAKKRADWHSSTLDQLTLVISDAAIEHVFYPVFPPNEHAQQVLAWLRSHAAER